MVHFKTRLLRTHFAPETISKPPNERDRNLRNSVGSARQFDALSLDGLVAKLITQDNSAFYQKHPLRAGICACLSQVVANFAARACNVPPQFSGDSFRRYLDDLSRDVLFLRPREK